MKTEAAVLIEIGKPLEIAHLDIPLLKFGQVLVSVTYSGVCHTQLLEISGNRGPDKFLPHGLGHEGSGIVQDVGEGVSKVKPGDHVVLSWMKGSGQDVPGTVYKWDTRDVNAGAITTFARHVVISENRLTVFPQELSFHSAALLGCAIPTGMGSVYNTAQAKSGESLVVFGVGGIGLCALAAASAIGCTPVIAVDLVKKKLEVAKSIGATHTIHATDSEMIQTISHLCPQGVDIAIEATGQPSVMAQALQCVRPRGGRVVVVGNAQFGSRLNIDPQQFNQGKQMRGTWGGDNQPDSDFPRYIDLMVSGRVQLEALQKDIYPLEKINEAIEDLKTGLVLRPLIRMA